MGVTSSSVGKGKILLGENSLEKSRFEKAGYVFLEGPLEKRLKEEYSLIRLVKPLIYERGYYFLRELSLLSQQEHIELQLTEEEKSAVHALSDDVKQDKIDFDSCEEGILLQLQLDLVCKSFGLHSIIRPMEEKGATQGLDLALLCKDEDLEKKITQYLLPVPARRLKLLMKQLTPCMDMCFMNEVKYEGSKPIRDVLHACSLLHLEKAMHKMRVTSVMGLGLLKDKDLKKFASKMKPFEYLRVREWASTAKKLLAAKDVRESYLEQSRWRDGPRVITANKASLNRYLQTVEAKLDSFSGEPHALDKFAIRRCVSI